MLCTSGELRAANSSNWYHTSSMNHICHLCKIYLLANVSFYTSSYSILRSGISTKYIKNRNKKCKMAPIIPLFFLNYFLSQIHSKYVFSLNRYEIGKIFLTTKVSFDHILMMILPFQTPFDWIPIWVKISKNNSFNLECMMWSELAGNLMRSNIWI